MLRRAVLEKGKRWLSFCSFSGLGGMFEKEEPFKRSNWEMRLKWCQMTPFVTVRRSSGLQVGFSVATCFSQGREGGKTEQASERLHTQGTATAIPNHHTMARAPHQTRAALGTGRAFRCFIETSLRPACPASGRRGGVDGGSRNPGHGSFEEATNGAPGLTTIGARTLRSGLLASLLGAFLLVVTRSY